MAYPYTKRPARPSGNSSGIHEANMGDFSGLRVQPAVLFLGGPTARLGYNLATGGRFVDGAALAPGQTYPFTLAQRVEAGAPDGQEFMPVPMTLTVNMLSGAVSTDRVAISIYGENQFGAQVREDFTLTSAAVGDNAVRGTRIFSRVTRVIVTARSGVVSGTVFIYVGASVVAVAGLASPRFGLPIHIDRIEDVLAIHVWVPSIAASVEPRTDGAFIVNLGEQSFEFTGAAITALSDTVHQMIYLLCRTSKGLGRAVTRVSYAALKGGS